MLRIFARWIHICAAKSPCTAPQNVSRWYHHLAAYINIVVGETNQFSWFNWLPPESFPRLKRSPNPKIWWLRIPSICMIFRGYINPKIFPFLSPMYTTKYYWSNASDFFWIYHIPIISPSYPDGFPRFKGSSRIPPHTLPLTVGSVAVLPEDHRVGRGSRRQGDEGVAAWDEGVELEKHEDVM